MSLISGLTKLRAYQTVSGKEFNEAMKGRKLFKLTTSTENHNGFQYKDGINHEPNFVNHTSSPGLHFTEESHLELWRTYHFNANPVLPKYIRTVTIPDDARVYVDMYYFKTNTLILGPKEEL